MYDVKNVFWNYLGENPYMIKDGFKCIYNIQ